MKLRTFHNDYQPFNSNMDDKLIVDYYNILIGENGNRILRNQERLRELNDLMDKIRRLYNGKRITME